MTNGSRLTEKSSGLFNLEVVLRVWLFYNMRTILATCPYWDMKMTLSFICLMI